VRGDCSSEELGRLLSSIVMPDVISVGGLEVLNQVPDDGGASRASAAGVG
jgi:hypothetical protein